jgi:hypothetical protein
MQDSFAAALVIQNVPDGLDLLAELSQNSHPGSKPKDGTLDRCSIASKAANALAKSSSVTTARVGTIF